LEIYPHGKRSIFLSHNRDEKFTYPKPATGRLTGEQWNMAIESGEKIKLLDEYIEILKQDLLFLMAERKRKPENMVTPKIITIRQELDRVVQEKMRLSRICHSNISNRIALTAAGA
jgi:hypothetical protein